MSKPKNRMSPLLIILFMKNFKISKIQSVNLYQMQNKFNSTQKELISFENS